MMGPLDPLAYLPATRIVEFPKNSAIYGPNRPCDHLCLVLSGRVKVFYTAYDGTPTLLRIACVEQFFGESSLISSEIVSDESATAIEATQLMQWTPAEILRHVEHQPMLGIGLVQHCAKFNLLLQERFAGMATYKTGIRVVMSLIQLVKALGMPNPDGSFRLRGMTHQSIADYAGTSREIVTSEMNQLRRFGCIGYTRLQIDVRVEALNEILQQQGLRTAATCG